MSPGPDLFVVCKQCGSEVSPYITECPYCGARLRRRAPKLPRASGRGPKFLRGLGRARPSPFGRTPAQGAELGAAGGAPGRTGSGRRARTGRRGGARRGLYAPTESPPYVTIALIAAGCIGWVLVRGGYLGTVRIAGLGTVSGPYVSFFRIAIGGPLHGSWWKLFTSPFAYLNGWYAFVALLTCAIFGWLLERRRGPVLVLVVFFGGAVSGALVALAVYGEPIVSGANAGALALLGAWSVPDLQAARRGYYYEGDLLGVGAIAATLLLLPYARPEASWLGGVVGLAIGLVFGAGMLLIEPAET